MPCVLSSSDGEGPVTIFNVFHVLQDRSLGQGMLGDEKSEDIIFSCYIVTVGARKGKRLRVFRHSKIQIVKTLINHGQGVLQRIN